MIFTGTSSQFYPEGLGTSAWPGYYAEWSDAAKFNATFCQLPSEKTIDGWAATVPLVFRFAVKASRYEDACLRAVL